MEKIKKMFKFWGIMMFFAFVSVTIGFVISLIVNKDFPFTLYPFFFALMTIVTILSILIEKIFK